MAFRPGMTDEEKRAEQARLKSLEVGKRAEDRVDIAGAIKPLTTRQAQGETVIEKPTLAPMTEMAAQGQVAGSEFKDTQRSLVDALQARAAGKAPSAAEMQLKAGGDRAIQAIAAQAA